MSNPDPTKTPRFDVRSLAVGAAAKEVLRLLLEESGYVAYPFGYESALTTIKHRLPKDKFEYGKDTSADKIRSMPDLLVLSDNAIQFVEVKFRSPRKEGYFQLKNFDITRYQKYWPESILAVLAPSIATFKEYFYGKYVRELEVKGGPYDRTLFGPEDFEALSKFFPKIAESGIRAGFYETIDSLGQFSTAPLPKIRRERPQRTDLVEPE